MPVRDAEVLRGHAVRALYLSAAAVDIAIESDDDDLLDALGRQWAATVARRTYLTGGMGSRHEGEAFGDDWELPPDRAYCETCAGVAAIMFSWRLLLATGESRYADLIERVLYNVIATSPAEDGKAFFYSNTLHRRVPGTKPASGRLEARPAARPAGAVVRGVVLPAERRAHARVAVELCGDGDGGRRPRAPVRDRHRSRCRPITGRCACG